MSLGTSLAPGTYFNTATELWNSRTYRYPLKGTAAKDHFVFRRLWQINVDNYSPAALDAADSVETSAYLVEEDVLEQIDKILRFYQDFATIPAQWIEPQDDSFTFPGYDQSTSVGTSKTISAYTAATGAFTTSASHDLSNGEYVSATFVFNNGGSVWTNTQIQKISSVGSTTGIMTPGAQLPGSFVSGTLIKIVPIREPTTLISSGEIVHDYFLPGVSMIGSSVIASRDAIPLLQPFAVTDATGAATDSLSSTTVPSVSAYLSSVAAGEKIPKYCGRTRYLGNIVRRDTGFVRAI
jgi:hypothetical protein